MTQIPRALAEELDLQMIADDVVLHGATGDQAEAEVYVADLRFADLHFPFIEVVVVGEADEVLIGREILARLLATFDGPRQEFTLEEPAS